MPAIEKNSYVIATKEIEPLEVRPMPAVFQIVSRASGQMLSATGLPEPTVITQLPASDQNPYQRWTLQPQDSAEDF
jgi:hypothetical protein